MVDDIIYLPWGISTAISVRIQVAHIALLASTVEGVDNLYLGKKKTLRAPHYRVSGLNFRLNFTYRGV